MDRLTHRKKKKTLAVTCKRLFLRLVYQNVVALDLRGGATLPPGIAQFSALRKKNPSIESPTLLWQRRSLWRFRTAYPIEHPATTLVWNSGVKTMLRQGRRTVITPFMMGYANSNTGLCVSQSAGRRKENGKWNLKSLRNMSKAANT